MQAFVDKNRGTRAPPEVDSTGQQMLSKMVVFEADDTDGNGQSRIDWIEPAILRYYRTQPWSVSGMDGEGKGNMEEVLSSLSTLGATRCH